MTRFLLPLVLALSLVGCDSAPSGPPAPRAATIQSVTIEDVPFVVNGDPIEPEGKAELFYRWMNGGEQLIRSGAVEVTSADLPATPNGGGDYARVEDLSARQRITVLEEDLLSDNVEVLSTTFELSGYAESRPDSFVLDGAGWRLSVEVEWLPQ
jgi:hypothetical protein